MLHFFTDDSCQALTPITHISWCGTQIISCSRSEVQHGYDILRSSSATANRLVHCTTAYIVFLDDFFCREPTLHILSNYHDTIIICKRVAIQLYLTGLKPTSVLIIHTFNSCLTFHCHFCLFLSDNLFQGSTLYHNLNNLKSRCKGTKLYLGTQYGFHRIVMDLQFLHHFTFGFLRSLPTAQSLFPC